MSSSSFWNSYPETYWAKLCSDFTFFTNEAFGVQRKLGMNICNSADFHQTWLDTIPYEKDLLIIAYRGSAKTKYCSNLYPLWYGMDRPRTILLMAASEVQSKLNIQEIEQTVETWDVLQHMRGDTWSKGECTFSNGTLIVSRGFGSSIRGIKTIHERPSLIVFDDIIPDVPTKRLEYYSEIFHDAVLPAIEPGAQVIVVGTPFTQKDILAELRRSGSYKVLFNPLIDEHTWPDRHNKEFIKREKAKSTPQSWARNFECKPFVPGGNMLKTEWLKYCLPEWEPDRHKIRVMAIDPAITSSRKGTYGTDYFAVIVVDFFYRKHTWKIIDMVNEFVDFPSQVALVKRLHLQYGPGYVVVESNFYQSALAQWLMKKTSLPIVPIQQTQDKVERILELTPHLKNGKIFLKKPINDEFMTEYSTFPNPEYHDDLLDALHMAITQSIAFAPDSRTWGFI